MKIDDALKPIWSGIILKCNFDVLNGQLELDVQAEKEMLHHITVNGIVSFLCLQEDGHTFNSGINHYYLEDIIFGHTKIKTSGDKWLKQFDLHYNLALDLFYSTLMLKAETIQIDGKMFDIT